MQVNTLLLDKLCSVDIRIQKHDGEISLQKDDYTLFRKSS